MDLIISPFKSNGVLEITNIYPLLTTPIDLNLSLSLSLSLSLFVRRIMYGQYEFEIWTLFVFLSICFSIGPATVHYINGDRWYCQANDGW